MSFAALKATTQAIQGGSGAFGGKKKKEDVATVVAGTHSYPKRPPRPIPNPKPKSTPKLHIFLPTITTLHKTLYIPLRHPHTQYIARSHMPKPLLTRSGARKLHKIAHSLHQITKTPPDPVFSLGPSIRRRRRSKINSHLLGSHMLACLIG